MKNHIVILLCLIILFNSCYHGLNVKPYGDEVSVKDLENRYHHGELIAVDEGDFIILCENTLYRIDYDNVREIFVKGYSLKSSKAVFTTFAMVFNLTVSPLFYYTSPYLSAYFTTHVLFSFTAIFMNNPEVRFKPAILPDKLQKLRVYARYPQGLDSEQRKALLRKYEQDNFKTSFE